MLIALFLSATLVQRILTIEQVSRREVLQTPKYAIVSGKYLDKKKIKICTLREQLARHLVFGIWTEKIVAI